MDQGSTQGQATEGPKGNHRGTAGPLMAAVSIGLHLALGYGLSQVDAPAVQVPAADRIELTLNPPAEPDPSEPATPKASLGEPEVLPSEEPEGEGATEDMPLSDQGPSEATPIPELAEEPPLLLKDPLHLPEDEEAPEEATLVAAKALRSKKLGAPKEDQRGASSLFNPELREVFPDSERRVGAEEAGSDQAPEEQRLKAENADSPALRASQSRDVIPDPNPRQAEALPSRGSKVHQGEALQPPKDAQASQAPGPKSQAPKAPKAPTASGDDPPPRDLQAEAIEQPQAQPPPPESQTSQRLPKPQKSAQPTLVLPTFDSLPPVKRVSSPLRVAALSTRPPGEEKNAEKPTAASQAQSPQGAPGSKASLAGIQGNMGYEGASPLDTPEDKGTAQRGLGDRARDRQAGSRAQGDQPPPPKERDPGERNTPLASQEDGADRIKTKVGEKGPDDERARNNDAPTPVPEIDKALKRADPAKQALMLASPPPRPISPLGAEGRSQYDRVAMLQGLKGEPPSGDAGREATSTKSASSAPPPGGGSKWPRPDTGVGGAEHEDRGAIPLSPEVVRRLSDQSGKAIADLEPGQFLDLSAKESPYWRYFSDAGRRFQRAWERSIGENPYFNVENDAATVRVAVVLNKRGKVEAVTYLERSYTALDDMVTGIVEGTRLGRFPRGYPDTLVIQLRVDTTGR